MVKQRDEVDEKWVKELKILSMNEETLNRERELQPDHLDGDVMAMSDASQSSDQSRISTVGYGSKNQNPLFLLRSFLRNHRRGRQGDKKHRPGDPTAAHGCSYGVLLSVRCHSQYHQQPSVGHRQLHVNIIPFLET